VTLEKKVQRKVAFSPEVKEKDDVIVLSREEAIQMLQTLEGLKRKLQPLVNKIA
jgi:hypothetical protein